MIYDFWCECGATASREGSFREPPQPPQCCGALMYRDFGGIQVDTLSCRDHDDIPVQHRVTQRTATGVSKAEGAKIEAKYAEDIAAKRKANRQIGRKGTTVMTHSIPTELYHGKIKQTGDRNYWQSQKNLSRHKSCKVL